MTTNPLLEELRKALAVTIEKVNDGTHGERACLKKWRPAYRSVAAHLRDLVSYAEDSMDKGNRTETVFLIGILEGGLILLDGLVHTPGDPKIQFLASFYQPGVHTK